MEGAEEMDGQWSGCHALGFSAGSDLSGLVPCAQAFFLISFPDNAHESPLSTV
jgi:hypothetical protein